MYREDVMKRPLPGGPTHGDRPASPTIGYMASVYGRVCDDYIRGEVVGLRELGFTVHTFATGEPGPGELVGESARREHASTEFLLPVGLGRLAMAFLMAALRLPHRLLGAAWLALRIGAPGLKGRLWPLAYLVEATYLAERLKAKGVQHLHNHIGEDSAAVTMLAAAINDIPYSLTIHGPGEFDRPIQIALAEKIRRAAFVATVSSFSRRSSTAGRTAPTGRRSTSSAAVWPSASTRASGPRLRKSRGWSASVGSPNRKANSCSSRRWAASPRRG